MHRRFRYNNMKIINKFINCLFLSVIAYVYLFRLHRVVRFFFKKICKFYVDSFSKVTKSELNKKIYIVAIFSLDSVI